MAFRPSLWRKPSTAVDTPVAHRTFQVTHPFHPLTGRAFELVSVEHTWGESRVFYVDARGDLVAMPVNWTNLGEADPYVTLAHGRAYCRPHDLLRLCDLIAERRR